MRSQVEEGVATLLRAAQALPLPLAAMNLGADAGSAGGAGSAEANADGWTWYYSKDDVTVYRKVEVNSGVQCVKGVGVIPTKPQNILK